MSRSPRHLHLIEPGEPPPKKRRHVMGCPDEAALTLYASVLSEEGDPSGPDVHLIGDWTRDGLHEHAARCWRCRTMVRGWRRSLASWQQIDVVAPSRFDDAYFEQLAGRVEAAVFEAAGDVAGGEVALRTGDELPLAVDLGPDVRSLDAARQQQGPWLLVAGSIAAVLAIGLLLSQLEPGVGTPDATGSTDIGALAAVDLAPPVTTTSAQQRLEQLEQFEAEGRALGRTLLATALSEDELDPVLASLGGAGNPWLDGAELDDTWVDGLFDGSDPFEDDSFARSLSFGPL